MASSASRTCFAFRSLCHQGSVIGGYGSVKTATLVIPSFLHEEITLHAISPRLAMRIFCILGIPCASVGKGGRFSSWPVFSVISASLGSLLGLSFIRDEGDDSGMTRAIRD